MYTKVQQRLTSHETISTHLASCLPLSALLSHHWAPWILVPTQVFCASTALDTFLTLNQGWFRDSGHAYYLYKLPTAFSCLFHTCHYISTNNFKDKSQRLLPSAELLQGTLSATQHRAALVSKPRAVPSHPLQESPAQLRFLATSALCHSLVAQPPHSPGALLATLWR